MAYKIYFGFDDDAHADDDDELSRTTLRRMGMRMEMTTKTRT